jgi:hypothetical protein
MNKGLSEELMSFDGGVNLHIVLIFSGSILPK